MNTAARVGLLDDLELDADVEMLHRLAERIDAVAVDQPRMQAALTAADLNDQMAKALVAGTDGRAARIREVGIEGFFPYSPYVGPLNPIAPPVSFRVEQRSPFAEVHAEHRFDPITNGPPNGVHGGVIAGVFDELLGCVCVVNDVAGFTGTLTVRYRSLTPLGEPISLRGRIDRVEGRKTFASGTFHHGDTLCAEADGVFIAVEAPRA